MKLFIEDRAYDVDMNRFRNKEIMAVEAKTGWTSVEWGEALQKGSMLAVTALVWVIQRREEPELRFDDVDFNIGAMRIEYDEAEQQPDAVGNGEVGASSS